MTYGSLVADAPGDVDIDFDAGICMAYSGVPLFRRGLGVQLLEEMSRQHVGDTGRGATADKQAHTGVAGLEVKLDRLESAVGVVVEIEVVNPVG